MEWINVDNQMPKINSTGVGLQRIRSSGPVLVRIKSGYCGVCSYDGEMWTLEARSVAGNSQSIYNYIVHDVTDWMYLPK